MMDESPQASLSVHEALQSVGNAVRFETSLRSRTEGITWIVWGLVSAATFLTFEAVTGLFYGTGAFAQGVPFEEQRAPWWTGSLWIPWLLVGVATTYALWRSASLAAAPTATTSPRHAWILLSWVAAVTAGWLVAVVVLPDAPVSTYPVMGIGTAWIVIGSFNLYKATRAGRMVATTIGGIIFVAGVVMAGAMAPHAGEPSGAIVGHVAALVTGLTPFLGGFWQTLRG